MGPCSQVLRQCILWAPEPRLSHLQDAFIPSQNPHKSQGLAALTPVTNLIICIESGGSWGCDLSYSKILNRLSTSELVKPRNNLSAPKHSAGTAWLHSHGHSYFHREKRSQGPGVSRQHVRVQHAHPLRTMAGDRPWWPLLGSHGSVFWITLIFF